MFTNATSVVIGGKEVQSIKITSNNAVLYEKPSSQSQTVSSVSLATDKGAISYYHTESATLSATVLDTNNSPVESETVEFFKGGTSIGTSTTNANGVATKTYSSTGVGDVSFSAECDNVSSTAITIEDCHYYNNGTINDVVIASGGVVTVENGALKITTATSGEKKWYFPTVSKFTKSNNVQMIFESAREVGDETNNAQILTASLNPSATTSTQGYASYNVSSNDTGGSWSCSFNNDSYTHNISLVKGDIIRFVREGNYTKLYHNNTLIRSVSRSVSNFYFGGYTNKDRVQRLKNIKIKAL